MGILDSLVGDVESVLGALHGVLDEVAQLGGVAGLGGQPAALRRAAQEWREAASGLRNVQDTLAASARSIGGAWEDASADAFAGQWAAASAQVDLLAADFDRAAWGLEDAAGQLDDHVALLGRVVSDIESVVGLLGGANPLTVLSAVQRGPGLVAQLRSILHDIEDVLSRVADMLRGLGLAFLHTMGDVAHWVGDHAPQLAKLGLDTAEIAIGLWLVDVGAGVDAGGLVLDATGVGALIGVPADVAGTAAIVAGAGLALHGGSQAGKDLGNLMSDTGEGTGSGDDAAAIGAAREEKVAEITGGKVQGVPGQQGLKVTEQGVGSTDVDVIGKDGEYISVGGPAKAQDLASLGSKLRILKYAADQQGVPARAYFERGTPDNVLELARQKLGADNVFIFDR
jgi:uncharacterized protein YukE